MINYLPVGYFIDVDPYDIEGYLGTFPVHIFTGPNFQFRTCTFSPSQKHMLMAGYFVKEKNAFYDWFSKISNSHIQRVIEVSRAMTLNNGRTPIMWFDIIKSAKDIVNNIREASEPSNIVIFEAAKIPDFVVKILERVLGISISTYSENPQKGSSSLTIYAFKF